MSRVGFIRLGIVAVALLGWQVLPQSLLLRSLFPIFDPFFVSSPTLLAVGLYNIMTGANGTDSIWPYAADTLRAALAGMGIGTLVGATGGLLLSNSRQADLIFRPFILVLNTVPRIALIPIIVVLFGPTVISSVVTSVVVVSLIVFYNAFEGGRSIAPHLLQNARLLGAGPSEVMLRVRLPVVLAWTFSTLPNAVSFGLASVITTEVITGSFGLGRVLILSMNSANATLTFSVVAIMSIIGVTLVVGSSLLRTRLLHWWDQGETGAAFS